MTGFVHHELPLLAEIDRFAPVVSQPAPPDILTIRVPGEIRGKARPRFFRTKAGGVGTFTDPKTTRSENWIRACAVDQVGQPVLDGPLGLSIAITVEVPASWSKRKRAEALAGRVLPTGRPDFDNTAKAICDALNKIVWRDDAQLVDVRVRKRYGTTPGAVLEVRPA